MPKRTDIKSILILGAGPIVIGQACEFDYSGTQACRALREEGYRVILVNSNPATIMTDPNIADATYIEPIDYRVVERIIEKERPDAVLPTMGGQTALNCALDLQRHGILEKYGVEMFGKGGFTRAVVAQNRHEGAGFNGQIHMIQYRRCHPFGGGIPEGQVLGVKDGVSHGGRSPRKMPPSARWHRRAGPVRSVSPAGPARRTRCGRQTCRR